MYALEFSGWAQCRLPTDPDPSNEPRGVSGYTFALPGEPDLDRTIRFQPTDGIVEREGTPRVGVFVRSGWERDPDGVEDARPLGDDHPLVGSAVDLEGGAQFDARNYVVVNNGFGVVWPFNFSIDNGASGAERVRIARSVVIDREHPDREPIDVDEKLLNEYLLSAPVLQSAQVLAETGIVDPIAFRVRRRRILERLRAEASPTDKVRVAALDKRIDELAQTGPVNRRTQQIPTKAYCRYGLNAERAEVIWRGVASTVAPPPWKLEMWFGGWDADALNFFVKGAVVIDLENAET